MKNKINNLLLEEGFRYFSEMSYEAYLPYQEKIECSLSGKKGEKRTCDHRGGHKI